MSCRSAREWIATRGAELRALAAEERRATLARRAAREAAELEGADDPADAATAARRRAARAPRVWRPWAAWSPWLVARHIAAGRPAFTLGLTRAEALELAARARPVW